MENIVKINYIDLSTSSFRYILDFEKFELLAKNSIGGYLNLAEFVFYNNKILFSQVIKKIQSSNKTEFNVLWGLLCRYHNESFELYDCNYSKMSKERLIHVLNSQLIDMEGEQLCYVRNEENIPFWDMIIYDDTHSWCISITHEDDEEGNRWCMERNTGDG